LIDFQHAVHRLKAGHVVATDPGNGVARRQRIATRFGAALLHGGVHIGQQHITRQGGLARTADTCDSDQAAQGNAGRDVLQVVHRGTVDADPALFCLFREIGV